MKSLGKYRILTLLAGLATALVIVFSQLFYFQAATYCQKKAETQQDQKKAGDESYISIPSSSISSVSHIQINQDLSFVIETLFDSEKKSESPAVVAPAVSRLFQTLFRFFVAPNAP